MRVKIRGSVRGIRIGWAALRASCEVPRLKLVITGGIGMFAALTCVGCSTGQVYVSQPQVNTRERLVGQRLGDTEWLRSQYENVDQITTTQQGIRDSRTFSGLYAEIAAKVDPSQGALGSLDIENQALTKRAENWRLREQEERARQSYVAQVNGASNAQSGKPAGDGSANPTTQTNTTPTSGAGTQTKDTSTQTSTTTSGAGTQTKDASTPTVTTPMSTAYKDIPALTNPSSPTQTQAKPMLLDLLHDRMAYRDAINATIKARELDDAHDLGGMMLYDLNFNLTVVPGDKNSQYVQVTLRLEPPDEGNRKTQLHQLFAKWCASLQATMASEIGSLQSRYLRRELDDVDRKNLEWFFTSHVGALRLRLQNRCAETNKLACLTQTLLCSNRTQEPVTSDSKAYRQWRQNCYESITDHRLFGLLDALLDTENVKAPECLGTIQKFQEHLAGFATEYAKLAKDFDDFACACAYQTAKIIKSVQRDQPDPKPDAATDKTIVRGIAWAVWSKYAHELGRIVDISGPEVSFQNDAHADTCQLGGLQVKPLAFAGTHRLDTASRDPKQSVHTLRAHKLKDDMSISDTGEYTFMNRLSTCESQLCASSVEPTEYAQNVSDVTARETLMNLAAAVQALFPQAGVAADVKLQDLQRSQDILHAIERRPLLTGFGMGQRRFGWVVGPKFVIENGKPQFYHTPLRHDCSASIVVPAWLLSVKLRGEYAWLDRFGIPGPATALWGSEGCTVNLPLSRDAIQRITVALTAGGPSDEPFLLTSRLRPRIEHPDGEKPKFTLQASGKDQSVARDQSSAKDQPPVKDQASAKDQSSTKEQSVAKDPSSGKDQATVKSQPQCLVICGQELWRSPQVFAGSQRASRVEVLSDMEGIQAYFNDVVYPGSGKDPNKPVPVDLLVVTAFGKAREPNGVTILPAPSASKAASKPQKQATLKTNFVDGSSTNLVFAYARPDSYGGLAVKIRKKELSNAPEKTFNVELWHEKNTEVSFDCKDDGDNDIMVADLLLYARPGTTDGVSQLKDGPVSFARFRTKADRSLKIDSDSGKILFLVNDGTDHRLLFTYPAKRLPLAGVAYPGFVEAAQKSGAIRLVLRDTRQGRNGLELPLRFEKETGADLRLEVPPEELIQNKAKILGKEQEVSWAVSARLAGTNVDIPIVDRDGKSVDISFKQEPNGVSASVGPAMVSCKDPNTAGEMIVTFRTDEFQRKCQGVANSIHGGKAIIRLTGKGGIGLVPFPAKAEVGTKEVHVRVQLKDVLSPSNRRTELVDLSRNPWTITLSAVDGSLPPVALVDTNNEPLRITFRKE